MRSDEHCDFDGPVDQYVPDAEEVGRFADGETDGAAYLNARKSAHRATARSARLVQQGRRITQLESQIHERMRERRDVDDAWAPDRFRRPSLKSGFRGDGPAGNRTERMTRRRQSRSALMWRKTIIFSIGAMALGTFGAIVVYDSMRDGVLGVAVSGTIAQLSAAFAGQDNGIANGEKVAAVRVVSRAAISKKKPIAMASLDVSDATGSVNTLIPLNIGMELTPPDQDIALRLSGLPDDAYLTAGTKLADSSWMLKRGEEMDIKLKVPRSQKSPLLIGVEAIDWHTGDFAAPPEELKVVLDAGNASMAPRVEPVSTSPPGVTRNFNLPLPEQTATAQPVPRPLEQEANGKSTADSEALLSNGKRLLDLGDFSSARAFLVKARDLGNREALLLLGQSYDPLFFRDRNVIGLEPNPGLARKYYLEARSAGMMEADNALASLEAWRQQ